MEPATPPTAAHDGRGFSLERAERANVLYIRAHTGDVDAAYLRAFFPTKGSWHYFLRMHAPELMRLDIMRRRTGRRDLMIDQHLFREYAENHLTTTNG